MPFPLAFTPMEFYYWCDDRPDYPACFMLELEFSGSLDRNHFTTAWTEAIGRQPLLRALVDDSGVHPMWVEANGQIPPCEWAREGVPITGLAKPIDLTTSPGVQCWVRLGSRTSRVVLRFHHSCCDGFGAFQFIKDVLLYYTREVQGEDDNITIRPLRPESLSRRARLVQIPERPPFWLKLRYTIAVSKFWAPLMLRKPTPLARASENACKEETETDRGFVTRLLDKDTASRLRQKAASLGATLNDLLLRDLFVVVGEWQTQNGGRGSDWLRINVPIRLRGDEDRHLPAANRLSFAFLTRRLRDCQNGERLLQSINEEMTSIIKEHLSLRFLGGLLVACRFRGMMKWFLNRERSYATVVLSNIGRVLNDRKLPRRQGQVVCGDVVLERVSGVPPIRPLTRASVGVITYANVVSVSLQGDPTFFDKSQVNDLLDTYVGRLKQTASSEV